MEIKALIKDKDSGKSNAEIKAMKQKFLKVEDKDEYNKFEEETILTFKIFEKVKVKVDTTTEFPLDVVCSLMFTKEDLEEYEEIKKKQEEKEKEDAKKRNVINAPLEEKLDDEV